MLELEIGIADRGDFSFDKFFLYFNVKKNMCEALNNHYKIISLATLPESMEHLTVWEKSKFESVFLLDLVLHF